MPRIKQTLEDISNTPHQGAGNVAAAGEADFMITELLATGAES
jgi:hypothetical protein